MWPSILFSTAVALGTFLLMEFSAWAMHKYVMHGFLWTWHRDHHQPHSGFFERNDRFFLVYAVPSSTLFILGSIDGFDYKFFIGVGIAMYGLAYFLVHDVFIHQRFPWLKRADSAFWRALRKAHKVHHKHLGKEEGECFGLLIVPMKYYREAREAARRDQGLVT